MELGVGATVGGYVLQQKLGAGAMGAVYRARHPRLDRDVALKVLHPLVGDDPEMRQRFAREADALSRLDHPHIVDVLDRGQDGDLLWMTMRFVPGDDLHTTVVTGGAFEPARALRIVDEIGQALDYAHAHGLLHRDVKPANILLRTDHAGTERAMLTDFGVAKDMTDPGMLTRMGFPAATVAYAAPEQLEQGPLDGRADVYSLAVVLFELLAGRRAFDAEELTPLVAWVLAGPVPDLRRLRPDLPPALADVLMRAMAKDRGERYASCAEFVAAARAALGAPVGPAPVGRAPATVVPPRMVDPVTRQQTRPAAAPDPSPARPRWVAALVALLALIAVAITVYALTATEEDPGGPTATGTTGTTTATQQTSAAGSVVGVGTCLDDAGAPTACDAPHAAEVFSSSDCSVGALLAYLGGAAGEDVLRRDVEVQQVGEGPACALAVPGVTLSDTVDDVLLGPAGDVLRRCLDELDREIPCSEAHTAEVIFEQSEATEPLDCRGRADAYLGRPFAQREDDLRLLEGDSTCVIEVRGSNVLTASLRRLGSGALPLG